jgi:hypothetical protein
LTIAEFEKAFARLDRAIREVLSEMPDDRLYIRPDSRTLSRGENLLRAAAAVEQMAGGITTRLWDDPFEWTLPEKLNTRNLILEYLDEVEGSRRRAFAFLRSDEDLHRMIPAPQDLVSLEELLADTLRRARGYLEKAGGIE